MLKVFPLLLLVVILYNIVALGGGFILGWKDIQDALSHAVAIPLFSGQQPPWKFGFGDFMVLLGLCLLFVEILKSTRTSSRQVLNHMLSMVTFIIALIEFITLKGFGTTSFFFIMIMCLFDVVAGYTISIVAAEHDLGLGRPNNT